MTKKSTYETPFRRRMEEKTSYKKRMALLKSKKPRFVVRKSNNQTTVQLILYKRDGDETVTAANSKELKKFGWTAHTGNLPAAYLTGLLCGLKGGGKTSEAIADIGLNTPVHGSVIFAAVRGGIDAGIKMPCDEKVFPKPERIAGKHISAETESQFSKAKEAILKKFAKQVKKDEKE